MIFLYPRIRAQLTCSLEIMVGEKLLLDVAFKLNLLCWFPWLSIEDSFFP